MIQREIIDLIEQYQVIIIHHHVNPDPDCVGSQLGLKYILQVSYPDKEIYAVGHLDGRNAFLGKLDEISNDKYEKALAILVDVGDKNRVVDSRFLNAKAIIKIDHHPLTESFANIEWVDTSYAACCEMIIDLYVQNQDRLQMTTEAARVLYAGLLTDTDRYYFDNVTGRTLRYGALAYKYDFDKQALYADIYYQSIAELKFKGFIYENFQKTPNGFAYMKLSKEILDKYNIDPNYAANCVNTLANILEITMWCFFVEYGDHIRVELRSRIAPVNEIAKRFGGGGHKLAAGAKVYSWEECDKIVAVCDETLNNLNNH